MKQKTFVFAASLLLGSSVLLAEKPGMADKAEAEQPGISAEQSQTTRAIVARAVAAIPLSRSSSGPRILPFVDSEGQLIAVGKPLLAFQILPFPDSRGNLIPIVKDGPAILPFPNAAGELIPIGKPQRIEPISQ
jgi:hypothetical protein